MIAGSATMAEQSAFSERFDTIGSDWHVADYDFRHDKFDTDWRRQQVSLLSGTDKDDQGGMMLQLAEHRDGLNRFAGASVRRENPSHYGLYEVRMKAGSGDGVVTGFFTYTGAHYGTRHDEIDIEFLGRNTRQMHVAWFVDGALRNHYIDLGFDAAAEMADYAFAWHPSKLRWFANGALVFEHDARDGAIPEIPGRLFVNIWAADPSIAGWAGLIAEGTQTNAIVKSVKFTPLQDLTWDVFGS